MQQGDLSMLKESGRYSEGETPAEKGRALEMQKKDTDIPGTMRLCVQPGSGSLVSLGHYKKLELAEAQGLWDVENVSEK